MGERNCSEVWGREGGLRVHMHPGLSLWHTHTQVQSLRLTYTAGNWHHT